MAQILNENNVSFDADGFLQINNADNVNPLHPCYFCYLGKTMTFTSNAKFQPWAVEKVIKDDWRKDHEKR